MTDTGTTSRVAPEAVLVVEGDGPADIARARDAARAFLAGLDLPPASDTPHHLALVVSELTSNAVRHGGGWFSLRLSATPTAVEVAVGDRDPEPPRERVPDNGGAGGFGWPMVRGLTADLRVVPGPGPGKTVLARVPL